MLEPDVQAYLLTFPVALIGLLMETFASPNVSWVNPPTTYGHYKERGPLYSVHNLISISSKGKADRNANTNASHLISCENV